MKSIVNIEFSDLLNALQDEHDELTERVRELEAENSRLKDEVKKEHDEWWHLLKMNAKLNNDIFRLGNEIYELRVKYGEIDPDSCGGD